MTAPDWYPGDGLGRQIEDGDLAIFAGGVVPDPAGRFKIASPPPPAEAMRTRDFSTLVTASWGLIARGRDSLPYLMLMLRSSNADSREDAAGTLGWLGKDSDGVVGELLSALEGGTEHQPRDSIVEALGALKNRAAIPALASLIRSHDTDGDTRRCAVESLGRIVRKRFDLHDYPEAAAIAWLDAHDA